MFNSFKQVCIGFAVYFLVIAGLVFAVDEGLGYYHGDGRLYLLLNPGDYWSKKIAKIERSIDISEKELRLDLLELRAMSSGKSTDAEIEKASEDLYKSIAGNKGGKSLGRALRQGEEIETHEKEKLLRESIVFRESFLAAKKLELQNVRNELDRHKSR